MNNDKVNNENNENSPFDLVVIDKWGDTTNKYMLTYMGKTISKNVSYGFDEGMIEKLEINFDELMAINCLGFPKTIIIDLWEDTDLSGLTLTSMVFRGDKIGIEFYFDIAELPKHRVHEVFEYNYWFFMYAKQKKGFKVDFDHKNNNEVEIINITYTTKAKGTLGDMYQKALKELRILSETAMQKSKEVALEFARPRKK